MEGLILSDEDLHLLSEYRIRFEKTNGYFRIYFKGGTYEYLHRYVIKAKKGEYVDHIDRNKKNNSRDNLRIVSCSLNAYNKDVRNHLGRGIYFDKCGSRYRACISHKNKTLKLGSFKDIESAKRAYNAKAYEIYKENAVLHDI